MAEFPYTTVPAKIKDLLSKIREAGVPPKATVAWLRVVGFRSSNDSTLLGVLKFIGLIDGNNVPTQRWSQYRAGAAKSKQVLGSAIRDGYKELYNVYADAHNRSNDDLAHVFATSTSAGQRVIGLTASTFKGLCAEATFDDLGQETSIVSAGPLHVPVSPGNDASIRSRQNGSPSVQNASPSVHIDIQVHISAESTAEQIDAIFKSMARHLYGAKAE